MGKSKTKTKNEPWAPAQPYILDNLASQKKVFDANQPVNEQYSRDMYAAYGRMAPGAEQGIRGAQSFVNDTLSGPRGNPYLEGILSKTRSGIQDSVNGIFAGANRYGSGAHQELMAEKIAEAENEARFNDFNQDFQRRMAASQEGRALMAGSQGLLESAAALPWYGVNAQAGNVRQNTGGYGVQTTTQSQGLGGMLGGVLGAGLAGWASGGFRG